MVIQLSGECDFTSMYDSSGISWARSTPRLPSVSLGRAGQFGVFDRPIQYSNRGISRHANASNPSSSLTQDRSSTLSWAARMATRQPSAPAAAGNPGGLGGPFTKSLKLLKRTDPATPSGNTPLDPGRRVSSATARAVPFRSLPLQDKRMARARRGDVLPRRPTACPAGSRFRTVA